MANSRSHILVLSLIPIPGHDDWCCQSLLLDVCWPAAQAATGQLPQQPLLQQPQVMPFLQPQWANPNQQGVISPNQQGPNSPIPQYQQLVSPTAQVTPTQPQPMVQVLQAQPMQLGMELDRRV